MKCRFSLAALLLTGICIASPVAAAEDQIGFIQIDNPWSRTTPKGATIGAGYMTIKNTGTEPDRLISGTTDVSAGFQLHEMTMEGDVSKMREMKSGIEIKPGEIVELKPGASHVMFVDLKRRLQKGERAVEQGGGNHMHH